MTIIAPECTVSSVAVLPLGALIASVGVSLPETVVPNAEIAPRIGVTDEWIVRRTGIRTRRVAAPDERLATHATHAAATSLHRAGIASERVDLGLVGTTPSGAVMTTYTPQLAK